MTDPHCVSSLYRAYLRQARALPHAYLRVFFRAKGADDFRAVLRSGSAQLRKRKLKRVSKDLLRLQAANRGQSTAFDRMLDLAYGRVGRLRWELMEPFLSGPNSHAPTYSPELAALLTSSVSRTTKALQYHHLVSPPGLSGHVKSNPTGTPYLGPLSRRREHNIRWRFFRSEWKKVYSPLQISPPHPTNHTSNRAFQRPTVNFGFQTHVLQELLSLAGSSPRFPEQRRSQRAQEIPDTNPFDGNLPLRWLRRRYKALLGRVPLLVSRPLPQTNSKPICDIHLADNAMASSRSHSSLLRVVDAEDVSWINDVYLTAQRARRRN